MIANTLPSRFLVNDPDGVPSVRSPDPDDDYLIGLAEASWAVIVSGDTDMHGLAL